MKVKLFAASPCPLAKKERSEGIPKPGVRIAPSGFRLAHSDESYSFGILVLLVKTAQSFKRRFPISLVAVGLGLTSNTTLSITPVKSNPAL